MKKLILLIVALVTIACMILPVSAMDFTAPEAPADVQKYIPEDTENFADGLWYVIKTTIASARPDLIEAAKACLTIIATALLLSFVSQVSKMNDRIICLLAAVSIGLIMLNSAKSFINIGVDTIEQVSGYGKLLLPALTAAAAANGTATAAAALYTGTFIFTAILTTLISKCIVPLIYIFIALCVADCAIDNDVFKELKKFIKWLTTWSIKTVLYIFTGYMGITGAVSGSVDAATLKAAKLTISGAVPVVGSILSDASESIIVSAGIMKNAAGIYGLLATIAICLGPFLKITLQYWLLKLTCAICSIFSQKKVHGLLDEMSSTMGLILAMTGAVCLLLLISIVCFIRSSV